MIMQRTNSPQGSRLLAGVRRGFRRGSVLPAAILTASALLLATAPQAAAQSGGWSHYEVSDPKVITIQFDTDLLAWDLCWSDHTEATKEQIVNAAIYRMTDPAQLYVIDLPGLPPFYRRTSFAPVWHDLNGAVITSSSVLPNRWNYHLDVEQALIDIAGRIREARPGAKLAFKNFEVQPLHNRPAAYTELGEVQDFYITDRTIYLNHVGHILNHALNSAFFRARVDFAKDANNWLVFPGGGGKFALASTNGLDWPPAEFEPEILALWGGGDEPEGGGGGDGDGGNGGGGSGNGGSGQNDDFALLVPGSGWSGPTQQPGGTGMPTQPGWDARAIARWDVVPHQVIDEPFPMGIVAFHMNEIDRVEFSVEGGPWVAVDEKAFNPRTNVWEYTVLFDPTSVSDGQYEFRAIAYPKIGEPRLLEPLVLYSNGNGTLPSTQVFVSATGNDSSGDGTRQNPYQTIWRAMRSAGNVLDNVTVYLEPGVYEYSGTSFPQPTAGLGWTTITAAPGVSRDDVEIVRGEGRIRVNRIRLDNVTLNQTEGWQISGYTTLGWDLWLSRLNAVGKDRFTLSPYADVFSKVYVTESEFQLYRDGTMNASIVRNVNIRDIGSDAFHNSEFVVNSSVHSIDQMHTDFHPDVFQLYGPHRVFENIILYNVSASRVKGQGVFVSGVAGIKDFAVVNVSIDKEGDGAWTSQIGSIPVDHLVVSHVSMPNMTWVWRSADIRNVKVTSSLWRAIVRQPFNGNNPSVQDEWYRDNHFVSHQAYGVLVLGTGITVGDPRLFDLPNGDFRPMPTSPLQNRVPSYLPADILGTPREQLTTIGAYQ